MMVKVGIGVMIFNQQQQILLGKRLGKHGGGTWAFPGGHLEYAEAPFDCAIRETKEETGLSISGLKQVYWTSDLYADGSHYLTLFILANHVQGSPQVLEVNKCERWEWFDWTNLPRPLFKSIESLLTQHPHVHTLFQKD